MMSLHLTPKSILKRSGFPHKPPSNSGSIRRSVSFCSEDSVRMADSYDRSPASPTTELSWSDIEELRRLQMDSDSDDSMDPIDEAKTLMDLPALLAAAPTALLPLLPPINAISRPVPTLTLPAPRNRGANGGGCWLAPPKRSASLLPVTAPIRTRPLLAFLPLLPVSDGSSPSPMYARPDPNAIPYFSPRPNRGKDADSPMTDDSSSPITPPDTRRMHPLEMAQMDAVGAGSFEITFKRRMESDW
ncbi:hypothetical protein DACRYDRAFT_99202 [Dacryopinax primogenitus]|uniref:Uncharacterized protein n=1 Tax=Dacryopinax primogenitus (strain DJM 731) TaxID=1858805 RepID=M5G5W1_DACPD|nr:uncharacterized protein DACRYDRAFT_99202 [Dacryopinax primogenitus]EJU03600.1 hypothetical protein DACRYDRAFT_99202 [Dacryopinax primogenitus]